MILFDTDVFGPDLSHLLPRPSHVAHRRPIVVISGVTPRVHHAIVNRSATEVLTSRPAARSTRRETGVRFVHGAILPIDLGAYQSNNELISFVIDRLIPT